MKTIQKLKIQDRLLSVEWSYPTSPNADEFGFPAGCWIVEIRRQAADVPQAVAGFRTREEAESYVLARRAEIAR